VVFGAAIGALAGAAATYLFFTEGGRTIRDRIEPAVDEVRREFGRFQNTIAKVGDLANDGLRVLNEFNAARSQPFVASTTSH
jgi:hypothetical protein